MNDAGIYGVNFYTLGVPHTVLVDDWLPTEEWNNDAGYKTIYADMGKDSAMWMPVLEKAFAKYHGNYEHIVGGNPMVAVRTMSNAPYESDYHNEISKDELWTRMMQFNDSDDLILAGTGGGNDSTNNAQGLVNGHAFVVQHVQESSAGRMVKVRNPWGKDEYHGDWSDHANGLDEWTDALRTELGHTNDTTDGVIWMTFDYYYANIEET